MPKKKNEEGVKLNIFHTYLLLLKDMVGKSVDGKEYLGYYFISCQPETSSLSTLEANVLCPQLGHIGHLQPGH